MLFQILASADAIHYGKRPRSCDRCQDSVPCVAMKVDCLTGFRAKGTRIIWATAQIFGDNDKKCVF